MAPLNPHTEVLFRRHPNNPILTAEQWTYPMHAVYNPAATLLSDGTTLLLCCVEDQRGTTHFCAARSPNGVDSWQIDTQPTMTPAAESSDDVWYIADPRIIYLPESGKYAITYTSGSSGGPAISLAMTEDFRSFQRYGRIMPPDNKHATLFPRRFGENWALAHSPTSLTVPASHIWISYSPDLRHWGSHKTMMHARHGFWWDTGSIELLTPLIETSMGWLLIYHTVQQSGGVGSYRPGLALFDLQTPERCLLRSDAWVFGPHEPYELIGNVNGAVFPCGYTIQSDGDTLYLYYGAAQSCIALATASLQHLLDWLQRNGQSE